MKTEIAKAIYSIRPETANAEARVVLRLCSRLAAPISNQNAAQPFLDEISGQLSVLKLAFGMGQPKQQIDEMKVEICLAVERLNTEVIRHLN